MSHEMRSQEGDPANPSSQDPIVATGAANEGITAADTLSEDAKDPGGKEAAEAKDAKGKK